MSSGDYKQVTMMMENPSFDGFSDVRSDRRTHHRMKPFVLVSLLLLAVVGVAVALAVILTGDKEEDIVPEAVTILGNLHISNRDYHTKYADKKSHEFARFEQEVVDAMDRVYNKSLFKNIYVRTSVTEIKRGSVIVDFSINLEIPHVLFDMKTSETKEVSALEYNEAYVHLVKAIDGNKLGDFSIIEFSLSFDSASLSFVPITMSPVTRTLDPSISFTEVSTPQALEKDACDDIPCLNGGTCVPEPETPPYFACKCPEEFDGNTCQNPQIPLCDTTPCHHGGTCYGDTYFFNCACTSGWGGKYCENAVLSNPCSSNPCQHGGLCASGSVRDEDYYTCICPPNYGGLNCENQIPPCDSSPCQHGGTCISLTTISSYQCACPGQYYGTNCESQCIDIPILQCRPFVPYNKTISPNPFQLAGDTDELLAFFDLSYQFLTPACHPDAQRVLCTIFNPMCTDSDQASILDYHLPCRSVCRDVHDSCLANLPQQLLEEFEVFGNFCFSLPESLDESVCFKSSQEGASLYDPAGCRSSPCENGGVCLELNGAIQCRCPVGYGGQNCAYELPNPCSPNPCLNGGECKVGVGSLVPRFTCECPVGYQPPFCDS
ncbi:neurogenic locus notch homolog protein 1-like isoform X2 [Asterias rubens]|uniref:neurogenic locus notch homolog protein 1-like isoform X2 n=1 Tax=Asterias rubens TaxID=7604 RepID=UPI0014554D9E|nr:neurogenic locus notch homolog protein 1-like isoform X2 [Asterias rubens]